jgi:uncharacterized protein YndB with AHSA1/START domain
MTDLTFDIHIDAPIEVVFAFFTDAASLAQWLGTQADVDPMPGGAFRVANDRDVVEGTFLEIVPYNRVVFTWGWKAGPYAERLPPGRSVVEVSLERDGDGTRVVLVHRGLPRHVRDVHRQGWEHCLPRLRMAASGGDPGLDSWAEGCQAKE